VGNGVEIKVNFWDSKRHILARNDVNWRTDRKSRCRGLGSREEEKAKQLTKLSHFVYSLQHTWHAEGAKIPYRIVIKFCTGVRVPWRRHMCQIVTIGSGLWEQWGSNFTIFHWIPLTYTVVLKTLWPCQCVIIRPHVRTFNLIANIHVIDHPRSGVVYNFSRICRYVYQTITVERLDMESSYSHIRYISRE